MATTGSNNIAKTHSKISDTKTLVVHPAESPSTDGKPQSTGKQRFLNVARGFMDIMVDGLSPRIKREQKCYDLIVVGGGHVGLTAALHAASRNVDTLVIDRKGAGGRVGVIERMDCSTKTPPSPENRGMPGLKIVQKHHFNMEMLRGRAATGIRAERECNIVITETGDEYQARALLLAPGTRDCRLNVPGEEDLLDAGIHFCATCDGPLCEGQDVLAITCGDRSAVEEALSLTKFANKVTLLELGDRLRVSQQLQEKAAKHPKMEVRLNTMVWEFQGSGNLTSVVVKDMNTAKSEVLQVSAAFIFLGQDPNTEFVRGVVSVDRWGFIRTDQNMETSKTGIFAAGSSGRSSRRQTVDSSDEGAAVAIKIRDYLSIPNAC